MQRRFSQFVYALDSAAGPGLYAARARDANGCVMLGVN
jgi:hypothetical protein